MIGFFQALDLQGWIDLLAGVATLIGVPVGAWALVQNASSQKQSTNVARGQFMLSLEQIAATHDRIHIALRPGGAWATGQVSESAEDWAAIDDYMGFFEHCELLIRSGSIHPDEFKALFGYRLENLMANDEIRRSKLEGGEAQYWELFAAIVRRFGYVDEGGAT